jgi:microcystin-dependent protein
MSSPFLGEIKMVGFIFPPRNYASCNGQLMSISQNTALFALLGTYYGGNGTTNFALPDLRGRVPVGVGQGAGLNPVVGGEMGGSSTVSITTLNMPMHTHPVVLPGASASTLVGDTNSPAGAVLAASSTRGEMQYQSTAGNTTMAAPGSVSTGVVGGNVPLSVMPPYLGLNFIIALAGIFPPRN